MNKYYETITNDTGDIRPGYRVQVLDSGGAVVTIYADSGGTRFTDSSGANVNYSTVADDGLVEFYWTAATGQTLQIQDGTGSLLKAISDFADNLVVSSLSGDLPQSRITDLVSDLAALTSADSARPTSATLAASGGGALVGMLQTGTGGVANTVQAKLEELPSVLDFIPVAQHAAIKAKTSTYDASAAFAAAHAAHSHVVVPYGKYIIGAMVEVGLGGAGQRGFVCQAGVELARTDTGITTPMFWLKSDDSFLIGAGKSSSRISTAARCPDGVVLIGHRDMTASHTNVFNCTLSGFGIYGSTNYGQTTGNPDTAVKLCNPQIGGLASYFHAVKDIRAQAVNYGIHLQGWANGNAISNIEGWYIGNGTLSTDRAMFFIDGAQENQISQFFLHSSTGSTAVKFADNDNTGTTGGSDHITSWNVIKGICEQDPTPNGGIGLDAPDGSNAGQLNIIELQDNCPTNNIGTTFATNNEIKLASSHNVRVSTTFKEPIIALQGVVGISSGLEAADLAIPLAADFTWTNQLTSTAVDKTKALLINPPIDNQHHILETAAPSAPFDVVTRIHKKVLAASAGATYTCSAGISLRNNSNGRLFAFTDEIGKTSGGVISILSLNTFASPTTYNATSAVAYGEPQWNWLRVNVTSTEIQCYISADGIDWLPFGSAETIATYVGAIDKVGMTTRALSATSSNNFVNHFGFSLLT